MESIQSLQGRITASAHAAKHLLAEMGDRRWSAKHQSVFDALVDEAERAEALLSIRQTASGSPATEWALQRTGLEAYLRGAQLAAAQQQKVKGAMSTTTPSEGGYSVGTLVARDLVDLLKGYGWMRQVAAQITTTSGGSLGYPTTDGTAETGELVAQNAAASLGDMSFDIRNLPVYRFNSKVFTVPIELLQDAAVDLVAAVMQRSVDRIGRTQNAFFTTGTGTGQPLGLVPAAIVGKTGNTGQTTTIIYDDLADMADSVDEAHLGMPSKQAGMPEVKAGWMFSQTMRKVVRKLKDTAGRPIWVPAAGGELPQLLDYPVFINNDMPTPAANAKSLAFGNLARYIIRDALQVTMLRMEDSGFALKGQVGFLAWARSGGTLLDVNAVKVYQHSAT